MTFRLTAGIVGYGFAGRNIHLPALRQSGVDLIGIADNDNRILAEVPSTVRRFNDYYELLDKKPDIVAICTPDHLHAKMCVEAAERGINVLLEKPMAISSAEAGQVVEAARRNAVQVCVVHQFRCFEPFVRLKQTLDEQGSVDPVSGRILFLHGESAGSMPRAYIDDPSTAVPLPFHVVHPFYLLEWVFGKPTTVVGVKTRESFFGLFETAKGIVHVDLSQLHTAGRYLLKIEANTSAFSVEAADPPSLWLVGHNVRSDMRFTSKSFIGQTSRLSRLLARYLVDKRIQYSFGASNVLICKFVNSIRKGHPPPISLDEAARAVHYTEQYYKACIEHTQIKI
jgi:predicted dehydrogenase